jgi:hypothetical protein
MRGDQSLTGAIEALRKSNDLKLVANLPVFELFQAAMAKSANGITDVEPIK